MVLLDWLLTKNVQKVTNATPSELIEMAIKDLEKCEKQKNKYKIVMGYWHTPNHQCIVCLAGAVMAQTLKAPVTMELVPGDFEKPLTGRLEAIDLVRGGYVGAYLSTLNVHNVRVIRKVYDTLAKSYGISITGDMPVTTYSLNSKKFKEQMLDIARACRKAGI